MKQHNSKDSRNCWKTARERDRMRARFSIKERVASLGESFQNTGDKVTKNSLEHAKNNQSRQDIEMSTEDRENVKIFLRHIASGSASAFSTSTLEKNHYLLDQPVPTAMLSAYKIQTLCTSRYGQKQTEKIQKCVEMLENCTMIEYASWLGEHRIVGSLLTGGIDPTLRGRQKLVIFTPKNIEWVDRSQRIRALVIQRFFASFPLALKVYIVKRLVDMRVEGLLKQTDNNDSDRCLICNKEHFDPPLLFGSPCNHKFCEHCFWEDIITNVDLRENGDVVVCPICGKSPENKISTAPSGSDNGSLGDSPEDRRQTSLAKFRCLPLNTREVKLQSKTKKKSTKRGILSSTWNEAVILSLGTSQEVRHDKWFSFAERNAFHYVKGCIVAGVDIDATNEYGQNTLYIAAWKGFFNIVKLLLEYGASAHIAANGGLTSLGAALARGHLQTAKLLEEQGGEVTNSKVQRILSQSDWHTCTSSTTKILIDPDCSHPGAGAFIIDNAIPSVTIEALIELRNSLPVDQTDKKKDRNVLCSQRYYYCDAEGFIRNILSGAIERFGDIPPSSGGSPVVFPHMRFLHYTQPGSILAPHVDLCRVDQDTQQRSTHTFILYLTDCDEGGETSLLGGVSGEKRNDILASVQPKMGRLLLFPHACPHEGNEVVHVPKSLLRGEVILF